MLAKDRPIPSHVWLLPPLVVATYVTGQRDEDEASSSANVPDPGPPSDRKN